jgi:hypothetical protein
VSDVDVLEEARQLLTASLADIVDGSAACVVNPLALARWTLRSEDTAPLIAYGVPIERGFHELKLRGDLQDSVDPEIMIDGNRAYRLGVCRWLIFSAVSTTGEVWAVPSVTRPDWAIDSAAIGVNSSVAGFVDLAWRWYRLRPLILAASDDAYFDIAELFLERLPQIDEALADRERFPWWRDLILDW